jgi:hypothetical protein
MSQLLTPGKKQFLEILARASPKETHHARSGTESKISSSKAYNLVPTLYAEDKDKGHKGIPAGVMAVEPYVVKGYSSRPRDVIHSMVFTVPEKTFEGRSKQMIDYGNMWEECALDMFHRAYGGEMVATGRIDATDPACPYACATPDGIWWDNKTDEVWVLEVKMPAGREIVRPPCRADEMRYNILDQTAGFVQKSNDPECPAEHYPWIYVKENEAMYPGHYSPQFVMECKSTKLPRAKIIQLEIGYAFHNPVLNVTDYMFDARIFQPLHEYWLRGWEIVQRGRQIHASIKEAQAEAHRTGNIADMAKAEETWQDFMRSFPWPAPEKGKPDTYCAMYMPYVWDKFEGVAREQDAIRAAREKLSGQK